MMNIEINRKREWIGLVGWW